MKTILKPYKSTDDFSYASGAYAAIELVKARPEKVRAVYIHPDYFEPEKIRQLCEFHDIPAVTDGRAFERIKEKENTYVLGVFEKYDAAISPDRPHVVLVNPQDMGNLGTIVRTMVGFGFFDLALVTPAADICHPKTVRASMGALFHMNFSRFDGFGAYRAAFPDHALYPFMLDGRLELRPENRPREKLFSLIFGNEATGLDPGFARIGVSVKIPQSGLVDSLNLAAAAAVGMYAFFA